MTETSIERSYSEDELERLLEFSLEVAIRVGVEMFLLAGDADKMEALHEEVSKLCAV